MPSEWQELTIGNLCDAGIALVQTGPFGSQLHAEEYRPSGVPVVPTEAIRNRQIDRSVLPRISEEKAKSLSRHSLQEGDILFARRGIQATGHIGYIRKAEKGFICGTGAILLRIKKPDELSSEFLSHVLADPQSIAWFKFHAVGATMPNLNDGIIRSFRFSVPPPKEQHQIALILNTLDDRIELIRKTNETLEEIARAIFKSWFVDFDPVRAKAEGREPEGMDAATAALFPTSFDDSAIGERPRGWGVVKIGDLATLDKGLSYKGDYLTDAGMPMINLGCFLGEGAFDLRKLKFYSGEFKPRHVARSGELVIANTDITQKRNVIGSPAIVPPSNTGEFLFTHHTFVLRPNTVLKGLTRYLYFALLQPSFRERAIGFATGTTVLALPRDAISAQEILLPDSLVISKFAALAESFAAKVYNNHAQSAILSSLRDTLLPRLISGKLRVPEAEKLVEAVL